MCSKAFFSNLLTCAWDIPISSATSTDAINGSQLYALEQKVGNMTDNNTTYTVGFNGDGAGAVTLDEIGKVDADGNPVPGITILKAADGLKIYQENGINYIVMELVEGITLKKYIEKLNKKIKCEIYNDNFQNFKK